MHSENRVHRSIKRLAVREVDRVREREQIKNDFKVLG